MSTAEFERLKFEHCLRKWGEYTHLAVQEPVPQVRDSLESAAQRWLLLADTCAPARPRAKKARLS